VFIVHWTHAKIHFELSCEIVSRKIYFRGNSMGNYLDARI
jgi:hypothetical protein